MEIACFDIETIPNQNLPENVTPQFDPKTVKHGRTKDPEKRQTKENEEQSKFDSSLSKKMSLHPDLCEIVAFCGAIYDTETENTLTTVSLQSEPNAVNSGWAFIYEAYHKAIPIVSFNGNSFDLPVILHRAMDLRIPISRRIYNELTKRYSTKSHYDLMQILADWDRQRWQSLDFYLNRFCIGSKGGHGSQVYGWWKDKNFEKIQKYCMEDVLNTCKLFAHIEKWIVEGVGVGDA